MAPKVSYLQLILFLVVVTNLSSALSFSGVLGTFPRRNPSVELPPEYETFYYTQTIDHFNYKPESYKTFQQRYILNFKYWGGASTSSPIFVYAGAECDVTLVIPYGGGFIENLGARFKGLLLYVEHRYYGESYPFGTPDNQNARTLGYLSSAQALADYAQLIRQVKQNLSAEHSPVIAVGGSYGGMLAAWLRLKYPHIVIGALASSAPILYFDNITPQDQYFVIVSNDFKNTSESCHNTIKKSWSEIDRVAAQRNGLETLTNIFSLCNPLNSAQDLKDMLWLMYVYSAQYDNPSSPYVEQVCSAIDGASEGTSILGRVAAGLNASFLSCHSGLVWKPIVDEYIWNWQTCTELFMPIGIDNNETMFEKSPFDPIESAECCWRSYGIEPRPHWITTEYGGHDIKSVLENFASNIIFSNGLRDPWSAGGVVDDISDSVVAIHTDRGAHCLDLQTPLANDSDWLVAQRDKETKIIALWVADYNAKNAGNGQIFRIYNKISMIILLVLLVL